MPKSRVLIVDDERVIAVTLAAILNKSGFDAIPYVDPLEALESARLIPPDLLLTDVVMPMMSGIDLAIELRKSCPRCKVLLFSGQAATSDMLETAKDKGYHFDILAKPIHPTELLTAIVGMTSR